MSNQRPARQIRLAARPLFMLALGAFGGAQDYHSGSVRLIDFDAENLSRPWDV